MRVQRGRELLALAKVALAALGVVICAIVLGLASAKNPRPQAAGAVGWKPLPGVRYTRMTLFPVVSSESADTSESLTLDAALALVEAVITEEGNEILRRSRGEPIDYSQAGAQVNQLVLINRSKKPLLLLAGEVISDDKQDRIIGKDRVVPAGSAPLPLDVFCVEHGRWTVGTAKFASPGLMVHPSVREGAAVEQDQQPVRAVVRGEASSSSVVVRGEAPEVTPQRLDTIIANEAPSESYRRIYETSPVALRVDDLAGEIGRRFRRATENLTGEHLLGVVVAYGDEVAWGDIFASPQLFEHYWPKLLRSYAVEALTRPHRRDRASLNDARDFLRPLAGRETVEIEPGIYRLREIVAGRDAQITLESFAPRLLLLHWMRILREN